MTRVVLVGMGAIGTEILRYLIERHHEVVGVIDSDPQKAGRSVAELTGLPLGVTIQQSVESAQLGDADVAVFSTKSRVGDIEREIGYAVAKGLDVVTTSEEMAFPDHSNADKARELDSLAKEKGVSIVGVGVNPGFVMDWVPSMVASASKNPSVIHVVRSVDVSKRRRQLQSKTGVGVSKAKFDRDLAEGILGHVGLVESAHLIALSLGKELAGVKHGVFPVLGSEDYVMGVRQFVEGRAGDCQIRLDLEMTMTSADFDVVEVKGDPNLKMRFEKGVFGDSATVALTVHAAERIGRARPGLINILDMPLSGK